MHQIIILTGWISFVFLTVLAIGFVITHLLEREWRAFFRTIFVFGLLLTIFGMVLTFNFVSRELVLGSLIFIQLIAIFLIIRYQNPAAIRITEHQYKIDERAAIFHRFYRLKPGDEEFDKFYREQPDKKEIDESIRKLPPLGSPGGKSYFNLTSTFQTATFGVIEQLTKKLEWEPKSVEGKPVAGSAAEFSARLKGYARFLGADLIGITKLNPAYVYSHIGRSEGEWGAPIQLEHSNAIAIAVKMDYEMIKHAPDSAVTTESSIKYFEAAKIAMILARYINLLGYEARAHVDGNYRVLCVPIAADAGLGELGRLGLLITPEFGPRIRLSVVTTNLPLLHEKPTSFGVQHFCVICKKCATNCPSNSIASMDKKNVNGVEKWQTEQESCYRFWRIQGSDCSVCINVCPYSNPNTLMHNLIRWLVRRNNFARRIVFWGDQFFYGKRRRSKYLLPDWHRRS